MEKNLEKNLEIIRQNNRDSATIRLLEVWNNPPYPKFPDMPPAGMRHPVGPADWNGFTERWHEKEQTFNDWCSFYMEYTIEDDIYFDKNGLSVCPVRTYRPFVNEVQLRYVANVMADRDDTLAILTEPMDNNLEISWRNYITNALRREKLHALQSGVCVDDWYPFDEYLNDLERFTEWEQEAETAHCNSWYQPPFVPDASLATAMNWRKDWNDSEGWHGWRAVLKHEDWHNPPDSPEYEFDPFSLSDMPAPPDEDDEENEEDNVNHYSYFLHPPADWFETQKAYAKTVEPTVEETVETMIEPQELKTVAYLHGGELIDTDNANHTDPFYWAARMLVLADYKGANQCLYVNGNYYIRYSLSGYRDDRTVDELVCFNIPIQQTGYEQSHALEEFIRTGGYYAATWKQAVHDVVGLDPDEISATAVYDWHVAVLEQCFALLADDCKTVEGRFNEQCLNLVSRYSISYADEVRDDYNPWENMEQLIWLFNLVATYSGERFIITPEHMGGNDVVQEMRDYITEYGVTLWHCQPTEEGKE